MSSSDLRPRLVSLRDDFESELSPELSESAIDVSAVRDVCRHYLNEFLKLSENNLDQSKASGSALSEADSHALDSLLVSEPLFSRSLRPKLWKILLGCHNKDTNIVDAWEAARNSAGSDSSSVSLYSAANLKQIHLDVDRTRIDEAALNGDYRELLRNLLYFYCESRGVEYKQGLNEILAPVLLCFIGEDKDPDTELTAVSSSSSSPLNGHIFNCFYSLISKFLPSIFNDTEFESLRAIFRCFRLLLNYHDPILCSHVDNSSILPELYATPWFITLFARDLPIPFVFLLWDIYLIEDDPFFHYFIALALLIQQRALLLSTDPGSLPMALRNLKIQHFSQLIHSARTLRMCTPLPFRQQLSEISHKLSKNPQLDLYTAYMNALPCLTIPAADLVHQVYSESSSADSFGSNKYILLDLRDRKQFEAGHLPLAIHVDPAALFTKHRMDELLRQFQGVRDCHLCFIGNSMKTFQQSLKEANEAARSNGVTSKAGLEGLFAQILQKSNSNPRPNYFLPHELMEMDLFDDSQQSANTGKKSGKNVLPALPTSESHSFPSESPLLDPYLSSFVHFFLSNGFPHVSICEGAYPACHFLVLTSKQSQELVDHDKKSCANCSPSWFTTQREENDKKRVKYEKERSKQLKEAESAFSFGKLSFSWGKKNDKTSEKEAKSGPEEAETAAKEDEKNDKEKEKEKKASAPSASVSLKDLFFGESAFFEKKKEKPIETDKEKEKEKSNEQTAANGSSAAAAAAPAAGKEDEKSLEESLKEKTQDLKRAMKSLFSFSDREKEKEKAPAFSGPPVKKLSDRPSEADAAIDLRGWMTREADIALFNCHEVRKIANSNQGMLIPRVLAISSGYIIEMRPDNQPTAPPPRPAQKPKKASKPAEPAPTPAPAPLFSIGAPTDASATITSDDGPYIPEDSATARAAEGLLHKPEAETLSAADSLSALVLTRPKTQNLNPQNEGFTLSGNGFAYLKRKRRIIELDRITSKKDRPCLLTFHWKDDPNLAFISPQKDINRAPAAAAGAKNQTIFMIDRPKDCIQIVRQKFLKAKEAQQRRDLELEEEKSKQEAFPHISPVPSPRSLDSKGSAAGSKDQGSKENSVTSASINSFLDRLEAHETDDAEAEEREAREKAEEAAQAQAKLTAAQPAGIPAAEPAASTGANLDTDTDTDADADGGAASPASDDVDVDEMLEQMLAGENYNDGDIGDAGSLDNLDDFEKEMERIAREAEQEKLSVAK